MSRKTRTGNDLGALEVLVGMQIAGRQGEPQPNEDEEQICAPPHSSTGCFNGEDGPASMGLRKDGGETAT